MEDRNTAFCSQCGGKLEIGSWPFCRGGHSKAVFFVIDDQLEGGARWCDTMGHESVWLDGSKSQWRREVAARELIPWDRYDHGTHQRKRREHDEQLRDTR